jgi:tripartite-type tricarboxylate transporter receptor subunit TctC
MTMAEGRSRRHMLQRMAAFSLASALPLRASAQESFYAGKTIRLIVGTGAGAGYDLVARMLADHMPRFIPGAPRIVVENMVGAGSLVMTNYLANRAPRDGTVMGLPLNSIILEPSVKLLSRSGGAAQFDLARMNWVGSPCEEPPVLWVMSNTKFERFADCQAEKMIVGASQPGADNFTLAHLNNRLLDTQMTIVSGYQGTNDLFLAADRGEIQGGNTAYSAILLGRPDWIRTGKVRILAQYGRDRMGDLKDVPTGIELSKTQNARRILEAFSAKFRAAYPFLLPQDVPAAQVSALRQAFTQTMVSAEYRATMEKLGLKLNPLDGEALTALVATSNQMPAELIEEFRRAMEA